MEHTDQELSSRRDRERIMRREAMLHAAQEVIAEKGYESATLEEIAQRAEFGKGTLYNYFPDGKEEILLAIFVQVFERMARMIDHAFDGTDTFRSGLRAFLLDAFTFFRNRNDLFRILMREAFRLQTMESDPLAVIHAHSLKSKNRLAMYVQRAIENGELADMNAHMLAHHILHTAKGIHMQQCGTACDHPVADPDELAETVLQLIMDGATMDIPSNA